MREEQACSSRYQGNAAQALPVVRGNMHLTPTLTPTRATSDNQGRTRESIQT